MKKITYDRTSKEVTVETENGKVQTLSLTGEEMLRNALHFGRSITNQEPIETVNEKQIIYTWLKN